MKQRLRIWIDLENPPHVHFFKPIIAVLEGLGHEVVVTARDFTGTLELARLEGIAFTPVGCGSVTQNEPDKSDAWRRRVAELVAYGTGRGFDLAASHASRTQAGAAHRLGIPVFASNDYEHATFRSLRHARVFMKPAIVSARRFVEQGVPAESICSYQGLKEHVYIEGRCDTIDHRARFGVDEAHKLVVVRPSSDSAHYRPKTRNLLERAAIEHFCGMEDTRVLVLPRGELQRTKLREELRGLPHLLLPDEEVDGPGLIRQADLVVSGGGTMIREAAVIGVPAVSFFDGPLASIDAALESQGFLRIVRAEEEVLALRVSRGPTLRPMRAEGRVIDEVVAGLLEAVHV